MNSHRFITANQNLPVIFVVYGGFTFELQGNFTVSLIQRQETNVSQENMRMQNVSILPFYYRVSDISRALSAVSKCRRRDISVERVHISKVLKTPTLKFIDFGKNLQRIFLILLLTWNTTKFSKTRGLFHSSILTTFHEDISRQSLLTITFKFSIR